MTTTPDQGQNHPRSAAVYEVTRELRRFLHSVEQPPA